MEIQQSPMAIFSQNTQTFTYIRQASKHNKNLLFSGFLVMLSSELTLKLDAMFKLSDCFDEARPQWGFHLRLYYSNMHFSSLSVLIASSTFDLEARYICTFLCCCNISLS